MLKQLVFAAGRGLGQQPALLAGANAAAPFSRLISSSASSHADRGEDALHASVAGSPVDAGARGLGEAVEPSVTGGRGDDALHASKYGSKGDDRARRMGESVEPKVHEAFDIPSEGANAAPDPDSAGRVGGADMGAVVDAVGGMMHGDKRRTQQAVSSMASEGPAHSASNVGQTTSTRWPRSMETTADGARDDSNRPRPQPTAGDPGAPLSSGYSNHSTTGAADRGDAPHPMHLPSDNANLGPEMGSGNVPGMGDGGPSGQQYGRLNRPGAPNVEDNMGMAAGTQGEDTSYDTAESGRDLNSQGVGRQP